MSWSRSIQSLKLIFLERDQLYYWGERSSRNRRVDLLGIFFQICLFHIRKRLKPNREVSVVWVMQSKGCNVSAGKRSKPNRKAEADKHYGVKPLSCVA